MNPEKVSDINYMRAALELAKTAQEANEVPVGAVVVYRGRIIAKAYNMCEKLSDPTAHAEMQALTSACSFMNSKILEGCEIFVSLEPCPMCAEAIYLCRPSRLIYAAKEPKRGFQTVFKAKVHPSTIVTSGLLHDESSALLKEFFKSKRL